MEWKRDAINDGVAPALCRMTEASNLRGIGKWNSPVGSQKRLGRCRWFRDDNVNAAAKGKRVSTQAKVPLENYRPIVQDLFATGLMPAGVMETRIAERTKASIRVVKAIMADVIHEGILAKTTRLRAEDGRVLYGTPEQIDDIMRLKLNIDAVSTVGSLGSQTDRTDRTDWHRESVGSHTTPFRGCVPTEPTDRRPTRRKK